MRPVVSVLYAEDNPADAYLTRAHFGRAAADLRLEVVHCGEDFIAAARTGTHAVLLVDQRLPDMDGIEVLRRLIADGVDTPIVLVTGIGDSGLAAQALRLGAADYVPKRPGYVETLPEQLREVIARRHLRPDAAASPRITRRRILLVDSNPEDIALYVEQLGLTAPHVSIEVVNTAADALVRLTAKDEFDLVISDYRLPGRNAIELIADCRQLGLRLPFIIVTNSGSEDLVLSALKAGASDCLLKHERHYAELALRIDLAIERHELTLANERAAAELASRQRTLAALRESEHQLNLALDAGRIGLWSWDIEADTVQLSSRWKAQLGYADREILNDPAEWQSRCHPEDLPRVLALAEQGHAAVSADYSLEYRLRHKDGGWRWFLLRADLKSQGGRPVRLAGSQIEITSLKHQQADLTRLSARMRQLSRRLLEVQESERRHLARELHDEIGQLLTATKMHLQSTALDLRDDPRVERLHEAAGLLDRLLAQVRSLSLDLRPPLLDDLGLVAALHWLIQQHQARSATPQVRLTSAPGFPRFEPTLETACYRIAQEAFTNALRHARASGIHITLRVADGNAALEVVDDGGGFDPEVARRSAERGGSVGILGMQERALLAGGTFSLTSAPGRGTQILATFPLPIAAKPL